MPYFDSVCYFEVDENRNAQCKVSSELVVVKEVNDVSFDVSSISILKSLPQSPLVWAGLLYYFMYGSKL